MKILFKHILIVNKIFYKNISFYIKSNFVYFNYFINFLFYEKENLIYILIINNIIIYYYVFYFFINNGINGINNY